MNPKSREIPRPRVARRPLPQPGSQPKVAAYDAELSLARAQAHGERRPAPASLAADLEPVHAARAASPAPQSFSRPAPAAVMKGIAPALSKQEVLERAYVAVAECEVEEVEPLKTCFFDTINKVKALTVANQKLTVKSSALSLARRRGYEREDLFAIAEIAYHYLFSGGTKLALALYEGLAAVAPDEPYFALALGLTHDHLGDKRAALEWYDRARTLDPGDARPDVNTAELYLEDRDFARAKQYLARAVTKARARNDRALERKAVSILGHLGRAA